MKKIGKRVLLGIISIVLNIGIIAGLLWVGNYLRSLVLQVDSKVAYVQDSLAILTTDVKNMKAEIQQTLEDENSLVEEYTVELADLNLDDMTYSVYVTVMPKTYTETTEIYMYFGTTEYPLELNGYFFDGTITLPLDSDYTGNATLLIVDGNQRSTEVLSGYEDKAPTFESVIVASAFTQPTVSDGIVTVTAPEQLVLIANDSFEFTSFNLIVEVDGTRVFNRDYIVYLEEVLSGAETYTCDDSLDLTEHDAITGGITCGGGSDFEFDALENQQVHIYLQAVTGDGITFTYDLYHAAVNSQGTGFVPDETAFDSDYTIYDAYGNSIVLE